MFQNIRDRIREWASSGPWYATMVKTALTHALVWVLEVLAGGVIGFLAMAVIGMHPLWALAFPLAGFSLGHDFYWDREYGPDGDAQREGWKERLDAGLDYFLPRLLAGGVLYVVAWVYMMAGSLL